MSSQFANERLLAETPKFSIFCIVASLSIYVANYFQIFNQMKLSLETEHIIANPIDHGYRLFTAPFMSAGVFRHVVLSVLGVHLCTWFTIGGHRNRWEFIICKHLFNYALLILVAKVMEWTPFFLFPQTVLLVAIVLETYMLESYEREVPLLV